MLAFITAWCSLECCIAYLNFSSCKQTLWCQGDCRLVEEICWERVHTSWINFTGFPGHTIPSQVQPPTIHLLPYKIPFKNLLKAKTFCNEENLWDKQFAASSAAIICAQWDAHWDRKNPATFKSFQDIPLLLLSRETCRENKEHKKLKFDYKKLVRLINSRDFYGLFSAGFLQRLLARWGRTHKLIGAH